VLADVGSREAIAPGVATVKRGRALAPLTVKVSAIEASRYARDLASQPSVEVVVREGRGILSATRTIPSRTALPSRGSVTIGGSRYRAAKESFAGFEAHRVVVTVLSNPSATSSSLGTSRAVAVVFIVAFLVLAFSFSVLASRALQGQISRFLEAARRLGSGDFSAPIAAEATTSSPRSSSSSTTCRASSKRGSMSYHRRGSAFASRFGASVRRSPRTSIGPRCSNWR
jgi:HAMP domain-containing protein